MVVLSPCSNHNKIEKDYEHAMELIEKYFKQKEVYIFDENIEMLLLYADICAEHNALKKAQSILKQEIKRKGYSDTKRKQLQIRLTAIRELSKEPKIV